MDIRAYNQRIESLKQKSDQLEDENFHDIDTITKRYVLRFRTTFSYVKFYRGQSGQSICRERLKIDWQSLTVKVDGQIFVSSSRVETKRWKDGEIGQ